MQPVGYKNCTFHRRASPLIDAPLSAVARPQPSQKYRILRSALRDRISVRRSRRIIKDFMIQGGDFLKVSQHALGSRVAQGRRRHPSLKKWPACSDPKADGGVAPDRCAAIERGPTSRWIEGRASDGVPLTFPVSGGRDRGNFHLRVEVRRRELHSQAHGCACVPELCLCASPRRRLRLCTRRLVGELGASPPPAGRAGASEHGE